MRFPQCGGGGVVQNDQRICQEAALSSSCAGADPEPEWGECDRWKPVQLDGLTPEDLQLSCLAGADPVERPTRPAVAGANLNLFLYLLKNIKLRTYAFVEGKAGKAPIQRVGPAQVVPKDVASGGQLALPPACALADLEPNGEKVIGTSPRRLQGLCKTTLC